MSQCAVNYMLLSRLLPDGETLREYEVAENYRMRLEITERCKYTTMLSIVIASADYPDWMTQTRLAVRLYHDADLAEVMDQQGSVLLPVNEYPNKDMQQVDEKMGLNDFLGEWLSFCLKHGRSTENIELESVSRNK